MTTRYCQNCDQQVKTHRPWSWGWFILVTIFTLGLGLVLYPLYWLFKRERCPICDDRNWRRDDVLMAYVKGDTSAPAERVDDEPAWPSDTKSIAESYGEVDDDA